MQKSITCFSANGEVCLKLFLKWVKSFRIVWIWKLFMALYNFWRFSKAKKLFWHFKKVIKVARFVYFFFKFKKDYCGSSNKKELKSQNFIERFHLSTGTCYLFVILFISWFATKSMLNPDLFKKEKWNL